MSKHNLSSITTKLFLPIIIVLIGTATAVLPVSVWAATLYGTSGPDTIDGTDNDDYINGLAGNDNLNGKRGNDVIYGLEGSDTINDGFGSDVVYAGIGNDKITIAGTRGPDDRPDPNSEDIIHGEKGRDTINAPRNGGNSFLAIYGGDDDDTIGGGTDNRGIIYAGSGNDHFKTTDTVYDVYGGPGDDILDGQSECGMNRAYGEEGNDRILFPFHFASGGPGDDLIQFFDCGGTGYGDAGNDELIGGGDDHVELHGGSGDDKLKAATGGDELFGEGDDDTLTSGPGATFFSCGPGIDTIIGFNAAEGDTKTSDCENF